MKLRLPYSQRMMLQSLKDGKPYDHGYPKNYPWITNTVYALIRRGLMVPRQDAFHGYILTKKGRDCEIDHRYYHNRSVRDTVQ